MSFPFLLACIFLALILEGFFSGSEMALISADKLSLHKQARAGNKRAKIALELLSKPEQILATTLIGNNLCVAFQATITTIYIYTNLGKEYDFYSFLFLSPAILIFGELIPKTIYQRYAEKLAPQVAPFVEIARVLFRPMVFIMERYTHWLSKKLQPIEETITGRQRSSHREELRYLLTYGQKETTLKTSERKMIRRILDFSKSEAKKALIPLVNVQMIPDTASLDDALNAFHQHGHSRLPIYNTRVDNIVGVLHIFDLFSELFNERFSERSIERMPTVKTIMQQAYYAPESQQLENLMITMQKRGMQMAIVVDEYGGAVGIVTLEDILEEIVGDINDEYDEDAQQYKKVKDDSYLVQAQMEVSLINEVLKFNIPKGRYETLSGFLLQQFDRIPEEGDELYYGELKFVIKKASNRKIQVVLITKIT